MTGLSQHRRKHLQGLAISLIIPWSNLFAADGGETILIDDPSLKNVRELVAFMRNKAGSRLPPSISDRQFYREFGRATVANIPSALANNIALPQFLLAAHPQQPSQNNFVPVALIFMTIWGIRFAIPIATLFRIVIGSLWIMYIYLTT